MYGSSSSLFMSAGRAISIITPRVIAQIRAHDSGRLLAVVVKIELQFVLADSPSQISRAIN
jgi:hypothetical protein